MRIRPSVPLALRQGKVPEAVSAACWSGAAPAPGSWAEAMRGTQTLGASVLGAARRPGPSPAGEADCAATIGAADVPVGGGGNCDAVATGACGREKREIGASRGKAGMLMGD